MLFNTIGNKIYKLHYQSYSFLTKASKNYTAAAAAVGMQGEVPASLGLHYYKNKNYKNKNYKNKNYKDKKLWVIQKIFLFAKNKN
jgi:hypothetical protein